MPLITRYIIFLCVLRGCGVFVPDVVLERDQGGGPPGVRGLLPDDGGLHAGICAGRNDLVWEGGEQR